MTMLVKTATTAALLGMASAACAQQVYWYDGATRRPLWAETGVLADFASGGREKSQIVRPAALVKTDGARHSPVFRDHAQAGAASRALPGGVLLTFAPGTGESARQAAFARHGLTVLRDIGPGSGSYLVASPAGEASLNLANKLFESGDFAAASPNWWQPRQLK